METRPNVARCCVTESRTRIRGRPWAQDSFFEIKDDTLLLHGGDEPISVIACVGDHMFCCGKTGRKASRACVIASLPFRYEQAHRACPCRRKRRAASNASRLACGQYSGGLPISEQAGCGSVGLQMRGVYHQAFSCPVRLRQLTEYLVEDPPPG